MKKLKNPLIIVKDTEQNEYYLLMKLKEKKIKIRTRDLSQTFQCQCFTKGSKTSEDLKNIQDFPLEETMERIEEIIEQNSYELKRIDENNYQLILFTDSKDKKEKFKYNLEQPKLDKFESSEENEPKQIEKELEAQISMDSDNKENSKDTLTVFNKDNTLEEEENGKIKEDNEEKEKKIIEEDAQKGQNGGNLIIITMEKKEEPNQITNPINNTIKRESNTKTEKLSTEKENKKENSNCFQNFISNFPLNQQIEQNKNAIQNNNPHLFLPENTSLADEKTKNIPKFLSKKKKLFKILKCDKNNMGQNSDKKKKKTKQNFDITVTKKDSSFISKEESSIIKKEKKREASYYFDLDCMNREYYETETIHSEDINFETNQN